MKVVVQRVSEAHVTIAGREVGRIGAGLCLLAAIHREDDATTVRKTAERILNLRIFNDADGKMNLALADLRGAGVEIGILAISNFTVCGNTAKSRRPSFIESAPYEEGKTLFDLFVAALRESDFPVATGEFGADMQVSLVNDGPVTLIVES